MPARKKSASNNRVAAGAQSPDLAAAFSGLKALLVRHAPKLRVTKDDSTWYYLETLSPSFRGKPVCFAGVRRGKNYVSIYLMPVYLQPKLLKGISPELKKRQQGKSCFNFVSVDPKLFAEIDKLAAAGFAKYRDDKLL